MIRYRMSGVTVFNHKHRYWIKHVAIISLWSSCNDHDTGMRTSWLSCYIPPGMAANYTVNEAISSLHHQSHWTKLMLHWSTVSSTLVAGSDGPPPSHPLWFTSHCSPPMTNELVNNLVNQLGVNQLIGTIPNQPACSPYLVNQLGHNVHHHVDNQLVIARPKSHPTGATGHGGQSQCHLAERGPTHPKNLWSWPSWSCYMLLFVVICWYPFRSLPIIDGYIDGYWWLLTIS